MTNIWHVDPDKALVEFWIKETERWQAAYYQLDDEIDDYNHFRDSGPLESMKEELAAISANVVESSAALISSLSEASAASIAAGLDTERPIA